MQRRRREMGLLGVSAALLAVTVLHGCGGDDLKCGGPFCVSPGPPEAARIETASGDGQQGAPNRELPAPIQVSVMDEKGRPVAGVPVTFTAGQGGGSVLEPIVESDADGQVEVRWTLGPEPGLQTLQASAESGTGVPLENSPLTLSAEAIPPSPARIVLHTGPSETAQNGVPFVQQPVVQVLDAQNQPLGGVQVVAAIASGDGTLSGTTASVSDVNGLATYTDLAILGATGPRTLRFTVAEPALEVTSAIIQVTAGSASEMSGVAPLIYEGVVGSPVTPAPSVLLKDAAGNPVAGVAVDFTPDRDASVSPTTVVSDERGIAQVTTWTLGTTANVPYSLTASVAASTLSPIIFTATPRPGAAGRLQIVTQPSASAQNGTRLQVQPVIQVTDQNGNPAPQRGLRVTASVSSGPGTLSNGVATTDASGRATFTGLTITGKVGPYTLNFSARGLAGIASSTVALAAGAASRLALISAVPSARSRLPLDPQPTVQVQDASGNPVLTAGIPIVASLTGASLGGNPTATTDGTGAASYSDLAIIGTPGSHTLTFSSPELTPAAVPVTLPAVSSIQVGEAAPVSAVVAGQITGTPIWILKDASGQTVADVPVTVTASAGGSVLADAASNGIGGVQVNSWTLAPTAGDQSLQITVTGTNLSNTVQVQATPAPAFALEKISGDAQTDTTANGELDSLLVVRLVDQYGNGISGVVIQWRTCDGTGDYDAVTTSDGSSSAAIDTPEVGTFCTRASTSGLPQNFSVDFTYTVTAAGSAPTEVGASQSGGRTAPTAPRAPLSPPSTR